MSVEIYQLSEEAKAEMRLLLDNIYHKFDGGVKCHGNTSYLFFEEIVEATDWESPDEED